MPRIATSDIPCGSGQPGGYMHDQHSTARVAVLLEMEFDLPAETAKGTMLVSGMYELRAPRLCARGSYVSFTDEMEQAPSAQRHLDQINAPLIVAHASLAPPDFQRQSRDFADALRKAGRPVQSIRGERYNRFEFIATPANPFRILGSAALAQMKLGAA